MLLDELAHHLYFHTIYIHDPFHRPRDRIALSPPQTTIQLHLVIVLWFLVSAAVGIFASLPLSSHGCICNAVTLASGHDMRARLDNSSEESALHGAFIDMCSCQGYCSAVASDRAWIQFANLIRILYLTGV